MRTSIELGRAGAVRGRLAGPRALSLGAARIVLESSGMSTYSADLDSTGGFDIRNLPPGEYTFSLWANGVRQSSYYLRRVWCSGKDYVSEPMRLDNGAVLNCELTAGDDTGVVSGRVSDGANPVADLVVVLIPESPVLRRQAHRTLTATTDSAGRYTLAGAIPGDYLLFAVPPSDDHVYFASDFADRNRGAAKRVTVASNGAPVVELQPLRPPR